MIRRDFFKFVLKAIGATTALIIVPNSDRNTKKPLLSYKNWPQTELSQSLRDDIVISDSVTISGGFLLVDISKENSHFSIPKEDIFLTITYT